MRVVRCLGCGARILIREGAGRRHCSRCGKPLAAGDPRATARLVHAELRPPGRGRRLLG